jgi:hypothetical protein
VVSFGPIYVFRPYYKPVGLENTSYLVLQGGHDYDMAWFAGIRQYNLATFTDKDYHLKSAVYIYRANHGQFNTVWGSNDYPYPLSLVLNKKPLLTEEEQTQVAKVYVSAFLEASMRGNKDYVSFLKDQRTGDKWLPDDIYVTRYQDSTFTALADYEDDYQIDTGTMPGTRFIKEGPIDLKEIGMSLRNPEGQLQQSNAAFINWQQPGGVYRLTINPAISARPAFTAETRLNFSVGWNTANSVPDIKVQLVDMAGQVVTMPLNSIRPVVPQLKTVLKKSEIFTDISNAGPVEQLLQFYELPFTTAMSLNPQFNPAGFTEVRFVFDSQEGSVIIDDIGIAR